MFSIKRPEVISAALAAFLVVGFATHDQPRVQAQNPCTGDTSNVTPPAVIGVGITDKRFPRPRPVLDTVYVGFKDYVKNVLPNEWLPGWNSSAYQAGAQAVKTFGWYQTIHWRPRYAQTGECFHVTDDEDDQVYVAGSSDAVTAYAVEQTWNWLLHSGGAIYLTYYASGYSNDPCGYWAGSPGDGLHMSQYGTQTCALAGYSWAQTVTIYYSPNGTYPGDHIYGQWHGAMGWGPAPWTPVSVNSSTYSTWKFRTSNSCGQPVTVFDYGTPTAIKLVGDWDGSGSHTQGVVDLVNGTLYWSLRNSRTPGAPDYPVFGFGVAGDIPVVGDWDNNGTWTPGVFRNGTWYLNNTNPASGQNAVFAYGDGNHSPIPGKWQAASSQGMAVGLYIVDQSSGEIRWLLKFANTPGAPDLNFTWGPGRGRPTTGDYNTSDGLSRFGPGFVSDEPPDSCSNPNPDQGWNLKYVPSGGGIDISYKYERLRP